MIVAPSILSADFANLERDIKAVTSFGAQWIHVDVMDGHFVPNITIGAPVVKSIRKVTNAKIDVHLMIENPEKYVDDFINAGADLIVFHIESRVNAMNLIEHIRKHDRGVGISLKPKTPVSVIEQYLKYIHMVLIMTVEPGFSGQKFMQNCALKIQELDNWKKQNNSDLIIQVDGGINEETAKICRGYGANCLVAGNFIFQNKDPRQAVKILLG